MGRVKKAGHYTRLHEATQLPSRRGVQKWRQSDTILIAPRVSIPRHWGVGTKYRPSTKDQKANLRFHQNARRAAGGPVKHSLHVAHPRTVAKGGTATEPPLPSGPKD
jgi:hypothetical protein